MENESVLELNEIKYQNSAEFFKIDFPGQNLEGNNKFIEFQKQKLSQYGKDAKLFKCKYDNLYFYVSKVNCNTFPFYFKECPFCHKKICYFCSSTIYSQEEDNGNCCIKRKLYYLFFHNGFAYINNDNLAEINKEDFKYFLILSSIPLIGGFLVIVSFSTFFFFFLELKDIKRKNDVNALQYGRTYSEYINQYYSHCIILTLYITSFILLSICFFVYDIYFKILLLFISLFSKFYPLKYFIGLIVFGLGVQFM